MDIFMMDLLDPKSEHYFCSKYCLFFKKKRTFFEENCSFFYYL